MKITTISASVRFSKAIQPGCYKTIELTAEAEVMPKEDWHEAQSQLYDQLSIQLKALWPARNGDTAPSERRNGLEHSRDTTQAHYCSEHGTEYRRYEKEGRVWYSHQSGDSWCKEKS